MTVATQLFQPDAQCPRCGRKPRIGLTPKQVAKWTKERPEELVQTYQCSWEIRPGRKCNAIFGITAGAIQRATKIEY